MADDPQKKEPNEESRKETHNTQWEKAWAQRLSPKDQAKLEQAFISEIRSNPELKAALEKVTQFIPRNMKPHWSCCVNIS